MIQPGAKLAHYEIVSALGKGGMGEVWRARDTKLGREVAIKTLPDEFAADADRLARFEREAKLLASLNHPNIAAIYGLGEFDDTRFLVLELVDGDTLADRLRRGAILIEEALKLALQITRALEAAHNKGLVHRDLKPANVKVNPEGQVKVLDFGLAKALAPPNSVSNPDDSPTLSIEATQAGIILGTAAYMSPEQAKGHDTDRQTDIWAFGCLLFELLSGRPAFAAPDVSEILAAVIRGEPDWSALPADLDPQIRQLLRRCIQKERAGRYRDIGDVGIEIDFLLNNPQDNESSVANGVGRMSRRALFGWGLGTAGLAGLSGFAAWTLRPDRSEPGGRFAHVLPQGQAFTRLAASGARQPGRLLAISPDGQRIVYVADFQLYLKSSDSFEAVPIPGTEEDPTSPFFSPDGQWVGYWSGRDVQLKRVRLDGGTPITICPSPNPFLAPRWERSRQIVWGHPQGIVSVPEGGGEPSVLIEPSVSRATVGSPQLLLGGEAVLFQTPVLVANNSIVVESLQTRTRTSLARGTSPRFVESTGHLVYEADGVLYARKFDPGALALDSAFAIADGIATGPAQYDVSETGALVYVPRSSPPEGLTANRVLAWVDRNGRRDDLPLPPAPYRSPRLSPDGRRLAVETRDARQRDIWVYDLDGRSQPQQMPRFGNNSSPLWHPDSERLTFESDRDGMRRLYIQSADFANQAQPLGLGEPGVLPTPDSWHRDGKTLAFTKTGNVPRSVWILSTDAGSAPPRILADADTQGAAFSPDGRWVVYRRNIEPGNEQLMMRAFPEGTGEIQLTDEGGSFPTWSPNGRELFYRRGLRALGVLGGTQPESVNVIGIRFISLDPTPRYTEESSLPIEDFFVDGFSWDVSPPDGDRFILVYPQEEDPAFAIPRREQINIVLNWHR